MCIGEEEEAREKRKYGNISPLSFRRKREHEEE
jgi:hypothetical protein